MVTEKRVCIIQSCYIPWKGFFDLIGRCDEYVVFDSVQFVKRHWHNRNKIITESGSSWLSIPVVSKSRFDQPINEVEIAESWAEKQWRTIALNYRKAPFFGTERQRIESWFDTVSSMKLLTDVNVFFLTQIARYLGLTVTFVDDRAYSVGDLRKTERLVEICRQASGTRYLSGPSARDYLEEDQFQHNGIAVEWISYGPYPSYPQLFGAADHAVSMIDTIFNLGSEARFAIRPVPGLQGV
jgi:WbqC-like protein family